MRGIAIYNNKGGVGKSTISLFLADFFATMKLSGKLARVLVIDLDAQNSSSNALLGIKTVSEARLNKHTISHFLFTLALKEKSDLDPFLIKRLKNVTPKGKKPLCELSVMMTDRTNSLSFEKKCTKTGLKVLSKKLKSLLTEQFDFIFIDLPANIDERNRLSQLGLMLSDYILIPTEPSRIAINSLPDTLKNIQNNSVRKIIKSQVLLVYCSIKQIKERNNINSTIKTYRRLRHQMKFQFLKIFYHSLQHYVQLLMTAFLLDH